MSRVEIHLCTFNRRTEDFLRRRHRALGFAAQDRRRNRQHLRNFRVRRRTSGNLIALHIPALHRAGIGNNPCPCLGQQFIMVRGQLIDQPRLQRLLWPNFFAFKQVRQGFFQAEHAHHAHHPATTRQ
ncbi:hypothetical protein D3C87_1672200 [compost metagenome]